MSYPSFRMTHHPSKGRCKGHMTILQFRRPQLYLRDSWSDSRQILYAGRIYQMLAIHDRLLFNWVWSGSRDLFY